MTRPKRLKTGVRRGGGPPPGYVWNVGICDQSYAEARAIFTDVQYDHVSELVKDLASYQDPSHAATQDVDAIENFFELSDKGGVLGGMNIRVFFGLDHGRKTIVVLGVRKKQNNGPTPLPIKVCMRNRWSKYLRGEMGWL